MLKVHQDVFISLVGVLIGVIMVTLSLKITSAASIFPLYVGILMIILSGFLLFTGIKLTIKKESEVFVDNDEERIVFNNIKRPMILIVFIMLYLILINYIGFYISTFIFIIATFIYFKVKKWIYYLIFPIVLNVLIYIVFDYLLKVNIPKGFWG